MRPRYLLVLLVGVFFSGAHAQELRFSTSLSAADRIAAGLGKLTSDQVAVVDALVRREAATRGGAGNPNESGEKAAATFSQRLTVRERGTSGLTTLSTAEIARLDAFVERYENGRLARTLLAPPVYLARNPRITPTEKKPEREIHGSFSLSYSMGSGGYSEKAGSMVLSMEDPARRYSITIGYSESHVKGGSIYRDPYYYDRPSVLLPDGPVRP